MIGRPRGTKDSMETRIKKRLAHLGKKRPEISGPNHPMFGKKNPIHALRMLGFGNPMFGKKRLDISERNRLRHVSGVDNPMFGVSKFVGAENPMFGRHHSEETLEKIRRSKHNYTGKSSGKIYPPEFCRIRRDVISDWGGLCALCGKPGSGRGLDVHHVDGNKNNNCKANLVPVDHVCHMKSENGDRVAYRLYFEDLQRQRGLL